MADERQTLRDWHRLFGLLLVDFFTGSPFRVEVEPDLSQQQQFLDVVVVRKGRGRFPVQFPDGLTGLAEHNLTTFKSHHEALDAWAIKELVHHDVAYRKLVSRSPTKLLPEEQFRLFAVAARFPHNLAQQVPWQKEQAGVYHCRWGTDAITVIVAGELPREAHNAPLHLFSASPELITFARTTYRQRSSQTSRVLRQLFEDFQKEGQLMPYTIEDFERDYFKKHFARLTAEEKQEVLKDLPPEQRLAGLTEEQIRHYLEQLATHRPARPSRVRSKKRKNPGQ